MNPGGLAGLPARAGRALCALTLAAAAVALPLSSTPASASGPVLPPIPPFGIVVYLLPGIVEGQPLNRAIIGGFSDPNCASAPGGVANYVGTIDWGDGTTSQAEFGGNCTATSVQGSHTYADERTDVVISVYVTYSAAPVHRGFGVGQKFNVGEGDVFAGTGGGTLHVVEGTALSNVQLGVFT
ncbi:MAG: hypothetical protein QOF51_1555, partial [Chloroflexota bacterium]|nr:hypothetical protein [Chloroflexota bacterium]